MGLQKKFISQANPPPVDASLVSEMGLDITGYSLQHRNMEIEKLREHLLAKRELRIERTDAKIKDMLAEQKAFINELREEIQTCQKRMSE
jgi:hypothetical protein